MKCLVTGGAGFIGSHIVDELIKQKHDVIVIDNESAESNAMFYYNEKALYYKLNITDYEKTRELYTAVDYVFHLAAESRIQPTLTNPTLAFKTNTLGTQIVLQCALEAKVKRVIYSSTSSAYGLINKIPLSEDMPNDCLNPYSVSKVAGEDICRLYTRLYNLPTTILRYFNVYGNRQPVKGQYAPVLGLFIEEWKNNIPLTIVGDGSQTRDFTHVDDVVQANMLCMTENTNIDSQIFNIGSGENISIIQLAQMISNNYTFITSRVGESLHTKADINKAKTILHWEPYKNMKEYIENTIKVNLIKKDNKNDT
jgi:UDP-glucose 4-epimerase